MNPNPSIIQRAPGLQARPLIAQLNLLLLLTILMFSLPALAGPGHDHGDEAAAPAGIALPRFNAVSELFELVGILNGRQLTLYLDHAATNAPVKDAVLDFEWAGTKLKTEAHSDGEFIVMLAEAPKPGVISVAITVTAGKETDLLAGEFDIHGETAAGDVHHELEDLLLWAGALLALILIAAWAIKRRNRRTGGSA